MTLWSGRVGTELAPRAWDFLKAADAELLPYDIRGTLLHAERLHAAGLLDDAELAEVRATLATLETVDPAAEDVHSFIEAELGDVGQLVVVEDPRRVQAPRVQQRRLQVVREELGVVGPQEVPDLRRELAADTPGPELHSSTPSLASIARASATSLILTLREPMRSDAENAVALRSIESRSESYEKPSPRVSRIV